jgi:hypothetical protein
VTIGRIRTPIFRGRTFSRNHMIDPDHIVLSLTARVGHARESSADTSVASPTWTVITGRPRASPGPAPEPPPDGGQERTAAPETTHARNANRWRPPT